MAKTRTSTHTYTEGTITYLAYYVSTSLFQLDRHMRRLDQDLSKFTIELEADTAGITEILEQSEILCLYFLQCILFHQ